MAHSPLIVYVEPGQEATVKGYSIPVAVYANDGGATIRALNNGRVDVSAGDLPNDLFAVHNEMVSASFGSGDDVGILWDNGFIDFGGGGGNNYVEAFDNDIVSLRFGNGNNTVIADQNDIAYAMFGLGENYASGSYNNFFGVGGGGGGGTTVHGWGNNSFSVSLEGGDNDVGAYYNLYSSIFTGDGDDRVDAVGEAGSFAEVYTYGGDDVVHVGGSIRTLIDLGNGNDIAIADAGWAAIFGGGGNDVIKGGNGADSFYFGDAGNDVIDTGTGLGARAYGGEGNDLVIAKQGDVIDTGSGYDSIGIYSGAREGTIKVDNFDWLFDKVDATKLPGVTQADVWDMPSSPGDDAASVFIQGVNLTIQGVTAEHVVTADMLPQNHDMFMA